MFQPLPPRMLTDFEYFVVVCTGAVLPVPKGTVPLLDVRFILNYRHFVLNYRHFILNYRHFILISHHFILSTIISQA